jgi:hypothetical protein
MALAEEGYLLLSNYVNCGSKIEVVCSNGHKYSTTWSYFQRGNRCPTCMRRVVANSNKYSHEFVEKSIIKVGYKLCSEYKGSDNDIVIECPVKHQYTSTWDYFQKGRRCPHCAGNAKKTTKEIEKELANFGYKLLSEYENTDTKISVECPQGHIYSVTWSNFKQGRRCPTCRRNTTQGIKVEMEKIGCELPPD